MKLVYLVIIVFNVDTPDIQSVVIRTEPASYSCEGANDYVEAHAPPGKIGRAVCFNREQADLFVSRGNCKMTKQEIDEESMVYTYVCRFKLSEVKK